MGVSILVTLVGKVDMRGDYARVAAGEPEVVHVTRLGSDNDLMQGTRLKANSGILGLFASQELLGYASDCTFRLKPRARDVTITGTSFSSEKAARSYLEARLDPLKKPEVEDSKNYALGSEVFLFSRGGKRNDKLYKFQINV